MITECQDGDRQRAVSKTDAHTLVENGAVRQSGPADVVLPPQTTVISGQITIENSPISSAILHCGMLPYGAIQLAKLRQAADLGRRGTATGRVAGGKMPSHHGLGMNRAVLDNDCKLSPSNAAATVNPNLRLGTTGAMRLIRVEYDQSEYV
ncbi:MAG: hypothetical protein K0U34_06525 [Alphaproteobacteria bacterium]|nr:hypothetical protein [Alphaproteobacteria bacterium]